MKYDNYTIEQLLDALPQNHPLYRDSGLWQIRHDDMSDAIYLQGVNESFRDFIERAIESMIFKGEDIVIL